MLPVITSARHLIPPVPAISHTTYYHHHNPFLSSLSSLSLPILPPQQLAHFLLIKATPPLVPALLTSSLFPRSYYTLLIAIPLARTFTASFDLPYLYPESPRSLLPRFDLGDSFDSTHLRNSPLNPDNSVSTDLRSTLTFIPTCFICKSFKMSSPKRRIETDVSTPRYPSCPCGESGGGRRLTLEILPLIGHEVCTRTAIALIPYR